MIRPERVDGTVEPEQCPDYGEEYTRFAAVGAEDEDEDEGGVRLRATDCDEEGEEEGEEDWDGPATLTFFPRREAVVQPAATNGNKRTRDDDEDRPKMKARLEEDVEIEEVEEVEEALGQISLAPPKEEVGFEFGICSLAFRPRCRQ